jgi:uncharacterized protein YgiM (DUF1202 family)
MKISVAPIAVTGYIWYGVYSDAFGGGWVIENDLQGTAPPPTGDLTAGDTVRVTENLNMRSGAGTNFGIVATLPAGTTGKVLAGPRAGSGYTWYQIQASAGSGWVVRDWITKTTAPPPATHKFAIGDSIQITDTMNMRSGAGTNFGIVASLPAGTTGTVLEGPRTASGYTWWRLRTTAGTGWAAQDWVQKTASTPPPEEPTDPPPATGKFAINDTVRVTATLNMRSGAGTTNGIVATLPTGTTGKVLGGPRTASGYTWWQIQTSQGTGWAAQDWLVKTTTTTPPPDEGTPPPATGKFAIGASVRVTESLNIRSGAGTGNGIVATLPAGTTGTVLEGPRTGSGYTWWRIQTSRGTGWGAENWLAAASGSTPPPPSGAFQSGDTVQVSDGGLRLRSSASTSSSVIAVMPQGHRLTITAGSRSGGGYTWWPVRSTTYGSGWVAQDFIDKV